MRHIPEDELHAYLDQALSRSQCVEIESHLARCPACQAERDAIAALRDRTTGLLALLTKDSDAEVRTTAERTLSRLPAEAVAALLGRADTPAELRDFFAARGILAATAAAGDGDAPLVDTDETDYGDEAQSAEEKAASAKRLSEMSVPEKVKAAMKGTREMRATLIRDPNKMVAAAVRTTSTTTPSVRKS